MKKQIQIVISSVILAMLPRRIQMGIVLWAYATVITIVHGLHQVQGLAKLPMEIASILLLLHLNAKKVVRILERVPFMIVSIHSAFVSIPAETA